MQWWVQVFIGIVWCTAVVIITILSLSGAEQAVEEGLAGEFSGTQTAVALISAVVFALPGIGFIAFGLRNRSRNRS